MIRRRRHALNRKPWMAPFRQRSCVLCRLGQKLEDDYVAGSMTASRLIAAGRKAEADVVEQRLEDAYDLAHLLGVTHTGEDL